MLLRTASPKNNCKIILKIIKYKMMKNKNFFEGLIIIFFGVLLAFGVLVLRYEREREFVELVIKEEAFEPQRSLEEVERILEQRRRFDINTADANKLQRIPGIGPHLADKIIRKRDLKGGFSSLKEMESIRGIGPVTIERIEEYAIF